MKKIFSLLFVLLCTICSWAQTSVSTFAELKSACSTGGNVKMTANIKMDERLTLEGTTQLVLDLNGHTLDRGLTEYTDFGSVFEVFNSAKLTINDSSTGKTGKITGVNYYFAISLFDASTVILNGGSICNNIFIRDIIWSVDDATFIMNGGSIKNNILSSNDSTPVYVILNNDDAVVKLLGGEISGNRLSQSDPIYTPSRIVSNLSSAPCEIGGNFVIKDNILNDDFGDHTLNISKRDGVKVSTSTPLAEGAEIHVTGTTNFDIPGLTSDNVKYFVSDETGAVLYCNEDGKLTVHTHSWATAWTKTDTHHYHACSATGCGMTDYSAAPAEAAYGAHVYGTDITQTAYYTCSTCQYENATRKQEYMDAIDAAAAAAATAKVNAIGTVVYTEECKALIDAAREAIDALTEAQQALVSMLTYTTLENAEAKYAELKADAEAAAAVVAKIEAIGTVEYTDESLALICDARTAYNALTPAQTALITAEQLKVLEDAEARYTKLKADAIAAAAVVEKIEAIGTVELTAASKALIDDARAAYDALTEDQKALITAEQLQVLEDAEARYHELELMALAQPVIDLINAIGDVDDLFADALPISNARNAYDKLIPEAQTYVSNYDILVEAEQAYTKMCDFYTYRNFRAVELGILAQPALNIKVNEVAANAQQELQALEYEPELTLEQNKQNVDDIFFLYYNAILAAQQDVAYADAKEAGKTSIRLFLGISSSEGAAAAAEAGINAIDALEYDSDADIIANIDDIRDIVIDTKVAIVKAWIADFINNRISFTALLRQNGSDMAAEVESLTYDRSMTYDENMAKLEALVQQAGGEVTAIESIGAAPARQNGKYIENGKIVIVKNGKTYTAAGQVK